MGLLDAYRIQKSLAVLLASQDPASPQTAQALSRLKLALLGTADRDSRAVLLRLIERSATASMLPDLIRATRSEDPTVRVSMAYTLARFSTEAVRETLSGLLNDQHKEVRQAALASLASLQLPLDVGPVCLRGFPVGGPVRPTWRPTVQWLYRPLEEYRANVHHHWLESKAGVEGRDMDTRPRRFTERELKKVGVTLEDTQRHLLRCDQCGTGWVPPVQRFFRHPGARFRVGYWWCPKGCNHRRE